MNNCAWPFFPQTPMLELKQIQYKPWTARANGAWNQKWHDHWARSVQTRTDLAHMPYNVRSNEPESLAIGTQKAKLGIDFGITVSEGEWPMWPTASRSCVTRLCSTLGAKSIQPTAEAPGLPPWNFSAADDRKIVPFPSDGAYFTPDGGRKEPPRSEFNFFKTNGIVDKYQWERCYSIQAGISVNHSNRFMTDLVIFC